MGGNSGEAGAGGGSNRAGAVASIPVAIVGGRFHCRIMTIYVIHLSIYPNKLIPLKHMYHIGLGNE